MGKNTVESLFKDKDQKLKSLSSIKFELNKITDCVSQIKKHGINIEEIALGIKNSKNYKPTFITVNTLIGILNNLVEPIKKDINSIQAACKHEYTYVGCDSHHDYYECTKCGKSYKD